jgi:peptide alpha-N-acetyltransferase
MPIDQTPSGLQIRSMQFSDLDSVITLVRSLGWTTTRQDVENLLIYEPFGCFVAELKGAIIGTVTTTKYIHFGWVGMLLVEEEFRRRRIGTNLMKIAIRYLLDNGVATVRLEADPPGIPLYQHLHFQKECDSLRWYRQGLQPLKVAGVRQAALDDLPNFYSLDRNAFGDTRHRVLNRLFECSLFTLVLTDEPERGFLMARDSSHGTIFGPFIADSLVVADKLLQAGLNRRKGQTVLLGVPSTHLKAITLMRKYGFECKSILTRMYYGKEPTKGDSCLEYGIGGSATG